MSNFWEKQELIDTLDKNKNEKIYISVCERINKKYLDIRIYCKSKEDTSKYISTSKGITVELSKLSEIKDILNKIDI